MNIKNDHGLLINQDTNTCLGYLFDFTGHGIFDPNGKVEIEPEQLKTHNAMLSQAELKGLDENCEVGMYGTFYYTNKQVRTWIGDIVSDKVTVNGQVITFYRGGKVYRGRLQKDADCFNFRRIK